MEIQLSSAPDIPEELAIQDVMTRLALDVLRPLTPVMVDIDPVKYEIAVHRIRALLREGAAALARTSSSPLVTECGEYMVAIYDAEGHAAYVTAGVLPHLTGTEGGVKFVLHCYGRDPEGIHPGDQFILNDPYLLGMHTPDMFVVKPIFAGNEIVAWVGSLTHTIEVGAKDPGGTADSTDIFQEGIRIPCMKIVSRGRLVKHVFRLIERAVRSPAHLLLDVTAKIASNNVAGERLEAMLAQEGATFVQGLLRKVIQETEVKARAIIDKIPEGRWEVRAPADHNGVEAVPFWLQLAVEKKCGGLHFDFTGTSPQNPGPVNLPLPGTIGALFSVLVSTLFADLHWNRGVVSNCSVNVPEGCFCNPRYPAPCFASAPGPATFLSSVATLLVSQMALAAGLTEAACAPWNGSNNSVFMGGVDQYGQLQGTLTMDANAGGTGGTPTADGDDTAAYILAPGSFLADVEMYEANYPLLYLFRRQRRDSGGHGQYRGGSGGESGVAIHGSDGWRVGFRGLGALLTVSYGLQGGYPAAPAVPLLIRGVKPQEKTPSEYRAVSRSLDTLMAAGRVENVAVLTAPRPMALGDVYYLGWVGGGGFGDPLLREPERVSRDVAAGLISRERCEDMYGIVLAPEGLVDTAQTEACRSAIRQQRLLRARPGHRLAGLGLKVCPHCDQAVRQTNTIDQDPISIGHLRVRSDWLIYRQYICPNCGTLLTVQPLPPGD